MAWAYMVYMVYIYGYIRFIYTDIYMVYTWFLRGFEWFKPQKDAEKGGFTRMSVRPRTRHLLWATDQN